MMYEQNSLHLLLMTLETQSILSLKAINNHINESKKFYPKTK